MSGLLKPILAHRALTCLLLSIFALKLYLLFGSRIGSDNLVADEYTNLDYANAIKLNLQYDSRDGKAYRPPVYPVVLTIIKIAVGNKIVYYKVANILMSTLAIAMVYFSLHSKWRFVAALALAIHPTYFFLYELILAENLAIVWVSLLVYWLAARTRDGRPLPVVRFGLVSGLLVLTRPESLSYLLILYAVLILQDKRALKALGLMFVSIHFWLIRNAFLFGQYPILSTNAANTFYLATFPESTGTGIYSNDDLSRFPTFAADLEVMRSMDEKDSYNYYLAKGRQYLLADPYHFFRLLPVRVLTLLGPEYAVPGRLVRSQRFHLNKQQFSAYLVIAICWELAFWFMLLANIVRRRVGLIYLIFLAGLVLSVCLVIAEARYKIQVLPALLCAVFFRPSSRAVESSELRR